MQPPDHPAPPCAAWGGQGCHSGRGGRLLASNTVKKKTNPQLQQHLQRHTAEGCPPTPPPSVPAPPSSSQDGRVPPAVGEGTEEGREGGTEGGEGLGRPAGSCLRSRSSFPARRRPANSPGLLPTPRAVPQFPLPRGSEGEGVGRWGGWTEHHWGCGGVRTVLCPTSLCPPSRWDAGSIAAGCTSWGWGGVMKTEGLFGDAGGGAQPCSARVLRVSGMLSRDAWGRGGCPLPKASPWGQPGPPSLSWLLFPLQPLGSAPPSPRQRKKRATPAPPPRLHSQYHQCSQCRVG